MKNADLKYFLHDEEVQRVKDLFSFTQGKVSSEEQQSNEEAKSDDETQDNEEPLDEVLEKQIRDIVAISKCNNFENLANVFVNQFCYFRKVIDEQNKQKWRTQENLSATDILFDIKGVLQHEKCPKRELPFLIPSISLALYYRNIRVFFYPMLFMSNYSEFVERCRLLHIDVPEEMPLQMDIDGRFELYLEICEHLETFRVDNNLGRADLCALLYGYARKHFEDEKQEEKQEAVLPSPTRIWFAGASKADYETSLKADTSVWQGNPSTNIGDIVILYALSPYSHIHSVWRAINDASFNPFDLYCDRIEVGRRVDVPHITIQELKNDPVFKELPIVRKNLQGLNGVELDLAAYKRLQELFVAKDPTFDVTTLPQLDRAEMPNVDFDPERDKEKGVEEKILIPILTRLGYSSEEGKDWERQSVLKAGRKEKSIPDFVFFREGDSRQSAAPLVIEAKLDFKNAQQMKKDFDQGVSYARQLHSTLMAICDKEQIRIYECDKDGLFFEQTSFRFAGYWGDIYTKDEVFAELKKLIGKQEVLKLKK